VAEENAPQTPAAGGWDDGAAPAAGWVHEAPAAEGAAAEAEEAEEIQKSYDEFLKEKAEQSLGGLFGKKEVRPVTGETLEGKAFVREGVENFFTGKVSFIGTV